MGTYLQKLYLPLIAICLTFGTVFHSCYAPAKKNLGKPPQIVLMEFDTLKKAKIDAIADQINNDVQHSDHFFKFSFPLYTPTDTIRYWVKNGQPTLITLLPGRELLKIWPVFYIHDDQLILVRSRVSSIELAMQWARETMIYLEDGKIVYCEERGRYLAAGEPFGIVTLLEYSKTARSQSEIEKEYKEAWPLINEAVAQHMKDIPSTE